MNNSNRNDSSSWKLKFTRFFKPAYREVDLLKLKIDQQNGLLTFKWHKYTIEELFDSEHHRKIDSVTRKIADDISNLYKRGEIPEKYKEIYEEQKEILLDQLHEVNIQISNRKPTWLESAWLVLTQFVEKIRENMPYLLRNLIEQAGILIKQLPGIGIFGQLLLPPARSERKSDDDVKPK